MECSIQRGDIAELNRTFHLSLKENILTIVRIKTFIICFIYQDRLLIFTEQFVKQLIS